MTALTHPIPVILDGDPGHDDAIAWLLAAAFQKQGLLDIRAITTVGGNAPLDKTTYNMLRIATLYGLKTRANGEPIPMAAGCARPLVQEPQSAPSVHGESGLDGPALPEPELATVDQSAVELMAQVLSESAEPIVIVPTGPLTNVATLLRDHSELKPKIARISLMGGGILAGNWSPAAEFNIMVDPEAAKIVFNSGIPLTMAGLDVTNKAYVTFADEQRVRDVGGELAEVVADWLDFFYRFHKQLGYPGGPVHDPVAVAVLVHPEIFDIRDMYVDVETTGTHGWGATIGDYYEVSGRPANVSVIMGLNREAFVDLIVEAVETVKGK